MTTQLAGSAQTSRRVLVVSPHSSYRAAPFVQAASALDVDLLFASEGKHSVISAFAEGLHIDLGDPRSAIDKISAEHARIPFAAVVGTDDATTELAASVAHRLGLPHNPVESTRIANRKDLARERLAEAGLPVPGFQRISLDRSLELQSREVRFPCVLKPLSLSASRGVIRADDRQAFIEACERIKRLLEAEEAIIPDIVLAEDFVPGFEVAVEGMLREGALDILAIFDKPDPLDGPFFEETYYVTPSRLPKDIQTRIAETVGAACTAYGLREGPIHAECRINAEGVWILEVAARTIGGLCARLLDLGTGRSLEELVVLNATGARMSGVRVDGGAGVLMIPIPEAGILRRVEGLDIASKVRYVEDVVILAREGYQLVPWPEGSQYFGFIFARAPTAREAEAALRKAHGALRIVTAPMWKLSR